MQGQANLSGMPHNLQETQLPTVVLDWLFKIKLIFSLSKNLLL